MSARRLYLVRHGKAAAGFAEALDPPLDPTGRAQAEALAARLAPLGPLPIVVSPRLRSRETAAPLEQRWRREARIEPAVAEIPSPTTDLAGRGAWLRTLIPARWPELSGELQAWRRSVLGALVALPETTVVVTHYVAINTAVGAATGEERVYHFAPDNCSVTVLEVDGERLRVIERGAEGVTPVL